MNDLTGKAIVVAGSPTSAGELPAQLSAAGARCQTVADVQTFQRYCDGGGLLDAVVIAIGWQGQGKFLETPLEVWLEALDRNLEHAVFAGQVAARHMIARKTAGRIIYLSSVAALKPLANMSVLGTTLAALHGVARMAAVDLGPYGIAVNVVTAGWSDNGWTTATLQGAVESQIQGFIPLGRVASLNDIGDVCCFLASDQASYISGAIIPVDGGYLITKAGAANPPTRL